MKDHDPKDFDKSIPLAQTPFYAWLKEQDNPPGMLGSAMRQYYRTETKAELKAKIDSKQFARLQSIHHHFQWNAAR